ncbi:hypothetical protein CAPTEDRAFT_210214 [Capitella teleta]|uniref:Uncharacterized protein n=1 Tax=Capitella teleta TaxID=283909 RepID=R7TA49_CAPTE|nr:hypothetical protein CAPTEDRAFT_210214 [Capitella teleta]|eukprot:ELT90352.1 hypothetical protein CAPTEDRAFT_210214 [Capitella teleta]
MLRAELRQRDQRIQLEEKLQSADSDTDSLEQYTRRNSLTIAGIREETGKDPKEKVMELVNSTLELDPPLDITEVDRIHRKSRKEKMTIHYRIQSDENFRRIEDDLMGYDWSVISQGEVNSVCDSFVPVLCMIIDRVMPVRIKTIRAVVY